MLTIGCHLSSSRGYLAMGKEAVKINANTFQFFTRNPRGAKAKDIDPEDVAKFLSFAKEHGIEKILAHAPYTLNACSADEGIRDFARRTMADDLARMEYTPGNCYNFHPGSHVKQGVETGIAFIAEMLNSILKPEQTTTVLLETMSGKGSRFRCNCSLFRYTRLPTINIINRIAVIMLDWTSPVPALRDVLMDIMTQATQYVKKNNQIIHSCLISNRRRAAKNGFRLLVKKNIHATPITAAKKV